MPRVNNIYRKLANLRMGIGVLLSRMMRKGRIAGLVAVVVIATAVRVTPAYDRLLTSSRAVQHYLSDLRAHNSSLSPLERFVFTLVLSNGKAPQADQHVATPQRHS